MKSSRNSKKIKINKTEESLFTLLSLYVLINQNLETIYEKEEILDSEFSSNNNSFYNLMTDTIHEALRYQILLKTCAFLDEWNKIFGLTTEEKDKNQIKLVKRIAKPAMKQIYEWKQLRDFRNEAIAHHHRDKEGNNIYISSKGYHFPDTDSELYLMVFCLKKATDVINFFFRPEIEKVVGLLQNRKKPPKQRRIAGREIKRRLKQIEKAIDNSIADIFMRQRVIEVMAEAVSKV